MAQNKESQSSSIPPQMINEMREEQKRAIDLARDLHQRANRQNQTPEVDIAQPISITSIYSHGETNEKPIPFRKRVSQLNRFKAKTHWFL